MTLDIQLCGRYSPNIEIKCIKNVQDKALKRLNLAIHETENAKLSEAYLSILLSPLTSLRDSIIASLIGDHEQNTHARNDDTIKSEEVIQQQLKNVPVVLKNGQINLEAAKQEAAEKAQAEALAKARADEEEAQRLEEELSMDGFIYNQESTESQTEITSPNQEERKEISASGIVYEGEYVNG